MSDFFVGQIIFAAFDFAPSGFMLCNGATLLINQNAALYSLIGTRFGGDGKVNFQLPDLRGRTFMGMGISTQTGTNYPIAQSAGAEAVVLTAAQLPAHQHSLNASTAAGTTRPGNGVPSSTAPVSGGTSTNMYAVPGATVALNAVSVTNTGGGAGHPNVQPFLVVNAAICVNGLYPARN
jgi:microcystin-dependent protein